MSHDDNILPFPRKGSPKLTAAMAAGTFLVGSLADRHPKVCRAAETGDALMWTTCPMSVW